MLHNQLFGNEGLHAAMSSSKSVVVAIFNRFGDGIIAAVVLEAFIKKWKADGRRFLIFTSPQLQVYLKIICPSAEVVALNKKNIFHWLRFFYLKFFEYKGFDVGLNPYSYGDESKKIARSAAWCHIYKASENDFTVNYYDRVRFYLGIEQQGDYLKSLAIPGHAKYILFCPESSEARRSLTGEQCEALIEQLHKRWPQAIIIFAASKNGIFLNKNNFNFVKIFYLKKNWRESLRFVEKIREAEFVVSVDSGPLHIATALGKPVLALFSSALPATVINRSAKVRALRSPRLKNKYCEVISCQKPICMDDLNFEHDIVHQAFNDFNKIIEKKYCPFLSHPILPIAHEKI